jgi:ABC-type branched-subunit amino acid transport system ATPase component
MLTRGLRRPAITAIVVVTVIGGLDGVQGYAVSLFTPEIARTLQVGVVSVVGARVLALVLGVVLPLIVPKVTGRRQTVDIWVWRIAVVATALTFASTGLVRGSGGLVAVLCATAIVGAPHRAFARSLVVAASEPSRRVRGLSALQVGVLGCQLIVALAAVIGIWSTWDRLLIWLGGLAVVVALLASTMLDSLATNERGDVTAASATLPPSEQSWKEIVRAWRVAPSMIGIGLALLAVGMLAIPFDAVLAIYLHGRWHLGMRGTGVVFLTMSIAGLLAVTWNASRSGSLLAAAPMRLASQSTGLLALGAVLLGLGVLSPVRGLMVVAVALGSAAIAAMVPMLAGVAFLIVPSRQHRALSSALAGVMSAGSVIGVVVAASFENRHGARSALVAMAVLALGAAAWLRATSGARAKDLSLRLDAGRVAESRRSAPREPERELLACRGIDYSYGSIQVLYDVDFVVQPGEVVALLGTNGAGKSTLLKVISGLALPQRGTVTFARRDITFLDAEDRVGAGISQITGGQAVFGPMDVIENLQSFGYSLGRNRRTVDEAVERCFQVFPQLAKRRSLPAAALSGGEQQMLGLGKALMLRPRLLLIDELALGLAPVVVGPLVDMVRRISAEGTAVVIVEQSANVALSLVDRAYFMEKGAIRFDGRARDLLDRHDLLRAVFLEGAAKAAME